MAKLKRPGNKRAEQGLRIAVKLNQFARKDLKKLGGLAGLGKQGGTLPLRPLIESLKPGRLDELSAKAREIDPHVELPDFSSWYQIICPARIHPDDLVKHRDLRAAGITLISGINYDWRKHGTAVLGVVSMLDNEAGGVGVAPAATGRVVSQWRTACFNNPDAILSAVSSMSFGDVLLTAH